VLILAFVVLILFKGRRNSETMGEFGLGIRKIRRTMDSVAHRVSLSDAGSIVPAERNER
jgi:Sec-independent protein translocase protein TatA